MKHRLWAVPRFIKTYKFNPTKLLHADWMSDECSGPEEPASDEDAETQEHWQKRMAKLSKFHGTPEEIEDFAVLEVAEPEWRDEYVSIILWGECIKEITYFVGVPDSART